MPALDDARARCSAAGANLDLRVQADRFRNHAQQHDRRARDWPAAWRNWVSKAIETAPKRLTPTAAPTASGEQARWRSRLREFQQNRHWQELDWGPRPTNAECKAPVEVLEEFGFKPKARGDPDLLTFVEPARPPPRAASG